MIVHKAGDPAARYFANKHMIKQAVYRSTGAHASALLPPCSLAGMQQPFACDGLPCKEQSCKEDIAEAGADIHLALKHPTLKISPVHNPTPTTQQSP